MPHALNLVARFFLAALLCSCVLLQAAPHEQLRQNGIASYWMTTSEAYLAALYVEQPSADAQKLLESRQLKRMDIRITTPHWRPRSFEREWKNAITSNNVQGASETFAGDILAWTGMPKEPLQAGDRIVIDYTPGKSTVVSVNDVQLLTFANPEFFHVLLRSWIGDKPPYADFRRQMLQRDASVAAELEKRFAETRPDKPAQRKKMIEAWLSGDMAASQRQITVADSDVARNLYRLDVTRAILRHVIYPSRALRGRQEGTALVQITLDSDGAMLASAVQESSGHEMLDKAAIEAISRASFAPFPMGVSDEQLDFLVPVRFVLP